MKVVAAAARAKADTVSRGAHMNWSPGWYPMGGCGHRVPVARLRR